MHRINTSTAQVDKFGKGKNGFTGGNPQTGELPTALNETFFDSVQEEIAGVIEAAGIALSESSNSQLLAAMRSLFNAGRIINVQVFSVSGVYTPTPGTKSIIIEGMGAGGSGGGCPATSANQISTGNGGTAGSYGKVKLTSGIAVTNVTVGISGKGLVGTSGQAGGDTNFGQIATFRGGSGGGGRGPVQPPLTVGGTAATGGGVVIQSGQIIEAESGAPGQQGFAASTALIVPGVGGNSRMGGSNATNSAGIQPGPSMNKGAGGTAGLIGPNNAAIAGGDGGDGYLIVWEYA